MARERDARGGLGGAGADGRGEARAALPKSPHRLGRDSAADHGGRMAQLGRRRVDGVELVRAGVPREEDSGCQARRARGRVEPRRSGERGHQARARETDGDVVGGVAATRSAKPPRRRFEPVLGPEVSAVPPLRARSRAGAACAETARPRERRPGLREKRARRRSGAGVREPRQDGAGDAKKRARVAGADGVPAPGAVRGADS